jgi:site-specific DNA recombinase
VKAGNWPAKTGAVIYCRVSTTEQADNYSLETQEKACRAVCQREGLDVLIVFSEAESAKTLDRAEFQKMQEYCIANRKQVAAVVVYSVSRFSRVTHDHHSVKLLLDKVGIRLLSATEQISDTPMGRFTETLMSAQAQLDNELRAERTVDGMTSAVQSGEWVHRPPIGYIASDCPGGLRPDPDRAELVQLAFEIYAQGELSAAEVRRKVTALGLRNKRGTPVSPQQFDKMLKNPVYAGIIRIPSWGMEAKGRFEPLVTEELFSRVMARLQGNARSKPRAGSEVSPLFPLRVFVRCSVCGQGLTGSLSTGKLGGRYGYYACRNSKCRAVKFRRLDLHVKFLDLLSSLKLKPEMALTFREAVKSVWRARAAQHEKNVAAARKRVAELQQFKNQIIKKWIANEITKDVYDDQMSQVGTQLEAAGLAEGQAMLELAEVEVLVDFASWMMSNASMVWSAASHANQVKIQWALLPDGLVVSPEGFGTPEVPLFVLDLRQEKEENYDLASLIDQSWNPFVATLTSVYTLRQILEFPPSTAR